MCRRGSWRIFIRLEGDFTMMQPIDIKSHSFGTGLFGYKKSDVDQYVDTVYRAYDELFTENKNLRDEKDRLNKTIEENRLRIFELEKQVNSEEPKKEEEKKEEPAKKEEAKADTNPFTETKVAENPFDDMVIGGDDTKKEDSKIKMASKDDSKDSATSKFFQQSSEETVFGDGDDVFVGEIEDNRKPNKVMIGDGEEEGADDFEFL